MRRLCLFTILLALPLMAADRQTYVLRVGGRTMVNIPSGVEIHQLEAAYGPEFFWFRHDTAAYVVQDNASLRALENLVAPMLDLAEQQGALGKKQAALGSKQAALGAQQAALGLEQANLALSGDSDRQHELSRQQEELSRQQAQLGDQQRALGNQQGELGNKMAALSVETEKKLSKMIDDFVRRGVARKVSG
jgi:bla regulator protein blaR1